MTRDTRRRGAKQSPPVLPVPRSATAKVRRPQPDRFGLLAAKLSAPQLPPGLVPRPRLVDQLHAGTQGRVTLVSAGPGWGKTMLAAAWAGTSRAAGPVAWLSLDADDNDPVRFWSYVLAALRRGGAVPAGSPLSELEVAGPRLVEERLRRIARCVAALPEPVVLVLDDLHEIRNQQILDGLAILLRHPSSLRLMLVSRADPRLPLHRLRLRGELTEVRAADLAFTEAEATALFRGAGLDLTAAQRRLLLDRTEGWATGLRLAVLFADRPGTDRHIEEFAGDVGTVAEYLVQEVLDAQPDGLRRFLLRTSLVERLCAELADRLTGRSGGQRVLEQLEQANAFVVALDPGPRWFRYHPLLADLLRHRLLLDDPDLVPVLHRRAAEWFAGHGAALEAVRHAARAQDWPLVGRLVVGQAALRVLTSERQALDALLAEIPPAELSTTVELRACQALRRFIARDYAPLPGDLAQARAMLAGLDTDSRRPTEVLLRVLDLVVTRLEGDLGQLIAAARDVLAWLPEIRPDAMPAAAQYWAVAQGNLGVGLLWSGQAEQAEAALRSALAAARDAGLELAELNTLGHLALLEATQGRLHEAHADASTGLELAERRGWTMVAQNVPTYVALTLTQLQWNNLPEAQRMLSLGIAAQRTDGERVELVALRVAQVRLLLAADQVDRARDAAASSREAAAGWQPPPLLRRWLTLAEAEVHLATGDPAAALESLGSLSGDDPGGERRLLAARAHLALGAPRQADGLLAPLRDATPDLPGPDLPEEVEAWTVTALAADRLRADHHAMEALSHALSLAEGEGIRHPFVAVGGSRLPVLLRRQQRLAPDTAVFTGEVLGDLKAAADAAPARAQLAAPLTDRELTVLVQLSTMQSNAEIADELYLSVNTVKVHARALYRKLEVANRRQAVARARELGLI